MPNPQSKRLIFWAANVLALLGWVSINIYLPSIPTLEKYFSTNANALKLSITLFLIGFAFSQFFWGSLSERFGRVKAIIYGLCIADIGTLMAIFAPSIYFFNTARLIEGVGIGSASVLARTLLSDSFDKIELAKAFALISTTANIMPALAPIFGGYLLVFFHWQAIFTFLIIYTTTLIYLFQKGVNETHHDINPQFAFKHATSQYWQVFTHKQFLGYLLPYAMLSGGMLGFYAATPFIFISILHIPADHYAYLSILTVVTYIIGANISSKIAALVGFERGLVIGIVLSLVAGIMLWLCWMCFSLNIFTVILPMSIYTLAAGIVSPIANAGSMSAMSKLAGASGAVIGASLYAFSAILTAIITSLDLASLGSLSIYVIGISLIALIGFYYLILMPSRGTSA